MIDLPALMEYARLTSPAEAMMAAQRQLLNDERAVFCVVVAYECPACLARPGRPCVTPSWWLDGMQVLEWPHPERWTPFVERAWRRAVAAGTWGAGERGTLAQ